MKKPTVVRKPKTHFAQVPVKVAKEASKNEQQPKSSASTMPANVTFEPTSGKIEPYSFQADALYYRYQ
jgi:hypothetical protein